MLFLRVLCIVFSIVAYLESCIDNLSHNFHCECACVCSAEKESLRAWNSLTNRMSLVYGKKEKINGNRCRGKCSNVWKKIWSPKKAMRNTQGKKIKSINTMKSTAATARAAPAVSPIEYLSHKRFQYIYFRFFLF